MTLITVRGIFDMLLWIALTALIWPLTWWQMALVYIVVGGIQACERHTYKREADRWRDNRNHWMKAALDRRGSK